MMNSYRASVLLLVFITATVSLSLAQPSPGLPPFDPLANYLNVPQQYGTIQSAVNAAATGDVIIVADGTYNEQNITITNKAVTIKSANGAGSTIVNAGGTGRGFIISHSENAAVNLIGLTIQNALIPYYSGGGAVYVTLGKVNISNCTIQGTTGNAAYSGGPILNDNSTNPVANVVVSDCIIKNNFAANGCGITGCTVYNSLIYNNSAGNNPMALAGCNSFNCTVYNNTGGYLPNPWTAGGMASGSAVNCIFWGNSGNNGQQIDRTGTQTVTYSIIQNGWAGTGNLSSDPLFVNAGAADFHLQAGSPAINAGDPSILDLDGSRSDIGAFSTGNIHESIPTIVNFNPTGGIIGTTITITGTNFSTTPASNIVYFGATKATVTNSTATQLMVTVPTGATYAPISVLNTATSLLAYSSSNFTPTFTPSKGSIMAPDFSSKVNFDSGGEPYDLAIGDLNEDGKADIAVADFLSGWITFFSNTSSSGTISSERTSFASGLPPAPSPRSVAIGDLDGDGKLDLAVANTGSHSISIFRNVGSSGIIRTDIATDTYPILVAIGDLDGDGKADLAVTYENSNTFSVFRNTTADGTLSYAPKVNFITTGAPYALAIGDLDGDGKSDLAVANYIDASVSILRNTSSAGTLSFAPKVDFESNGPYRIAIGDLDGDGKADLAIANVNSDIISVLRNTGSTGAISFATKVGFSTGLAPVSVAIGDLDGDGKVDLAVANRNSNTVSILRNTSSIGTVNYAGKLDLSTGTYSSAVAIGDLDGDGKPDLAVTNQRDWNVSVFRNNPVFVSNPTDITLSSTSISENLPIGTTVGTLAATDTEGGTMTYSLVSGTGSTDNTSFTIIAAQLKTASAIDYETKSSYSIRIRVTDSGGLSFEKQFTISVTDVLNEAIPTNGLVAWYPFNGNANDESGNGNNGTVNGANLSTDRYGISNRSYNFDGISNFISAPSINLAATATITAWVNPSSLIGAIVDHDKDAITNSGYSMLYNNSTRGLYAHVGWSGVTSNNIYPNPAYSLTLNEWNHCVLVYSNGTAKLFLNGALVYSQTGVNPITQNNELLLFGKSLWGGNLFNGKLDDIGIWNRDLSDSEALQIYTASKQVQVITFNTLTPKTYGDPNFSLSANSNSGLGVTYSSSDPNVATVTGNVVTIKVAGTTIITASQEGNNVYGPAQSVQQTLTVNKAVLTATADNKSRAYGDANPTFTITYTGFKNSETSTVIDTAPTSATTATLTSNVGSYNIVPAGGTDNNYSFTYVNGALSITKAILTATADNKSKVFGDANPAFTIAYAGFKNSETASVLDTPPPATTTATLTSNVGNYNIVPAGGTDNNYSFTYVNGALSITKAILTATADNKSKVYGDANPTFTIAYTGFKNSETASVLDTPPTATTTATLTSNVGNYNIVPAGGTDNNYSFTYVNGTLSITKAILTATADNKSKVYGDANPAFTIIYTGLKNSETSAVINTAPTATTSATPTSNVGNYNIVPAGGTDNNYSFIYVNGTFTISKAMLTVTADNKSRLYGDSNPAFTITYTGFKNSETASVIDTAPSATTSATLSSNTGAYTIIPSGGTDNNYSFTYANGTLTITQATLTATADNKTRVYGEANPTLTITYTGFKNNETSTVIDTAPTATTTATLTSNVGNYNIVPAGGMDNNYSFTFTNGVLTITKAIITAIADDKTRISGGVNPLFTITYSGFKNGETVSVIDTTPSASTSATPTSSPGTYSITPSGGTDNNYSFTYVDGTLTILGLATQSITFTTLTDKQETAATFFLDATSSSGLAVTFSTPETDKVTITGSIVTILKPGKVTIVANQAGNIIYQPADPVSQTICILPEKPTITGTGLGSENVVLTSSSTNGNQWYINDTVLAGATSQTHTVKEKGLYQVKVTVNGCASELSDQFAIIVTDVIDPENSISLSLYPNPAGQELRIKLTGVEEDESSELVVYDLTGRVVSTQRMKGEYASLLLDQYSSGNYVLRISNKSFSLNTRFTKQ